MLKSFKIVQYTDKEYLVSGLIILCYVECSPRLLVEQKQHGRHSLHAGGASLERGNKSLIKVIVRPTLDRVFIEFKFHQI